jgi:glycosidase
MSLFASIVALSMAGAAPAAVPADDYRQRRPEDEVVYFLLPDRFENGDPGNDRGGLEGDRLATGYDPTAKGFFHGGDLKGVIRRLDYIQSLGATAIWLSPVFKNKVVQGPKGQESAGYHGYWVTDFTQVDPHLGTNADFKALVDAAHARGMKVYMDILINHTADVIEMAECEGYDCPYRSRADAPYSRRAADGAPVNDGFAGDGVSSPENFARLTDPNFAYTVKVAPNEKDIKVPAWLNDPIYYHNRGNSTFSGESSTMGDFVGLDDLMTENPRVVQGFIDIYGDWIDTYKVDGFRIDTAKHVNPEFWRVFAPAMLDRAAKNGIPHFHIFGEYATGDMDPTITAHGTRVAGLPASLDFPFFAAIRDVVGGTKAPDWLEKLFSADPLYGDDGVALQLPTFTGNHDFGRFAHYARKAFPDAGDAEMLRRIELAHAMLLGLRGVPVLYSGDEQGFTGDGGDQDAREDMFASKVAVYNDNDLIGTDATTAQSNFDPSHPLYRAFARLAKLRQDHVALRRGRQLIRSYAEKPGLFAVSRIDASSGQEILLAFNTSNAPLSVNVAVDPAKSRYTSLYGDCPAAPAAPGQLAINLPPLGYMICEAR